MTRVRLKQSGPWSRALRAAALLVVPVAIAAAPGAALKPLDFPTLRRIVTVSDPQISPDGTRVAYIRATGDYKTDTVQTEIELVDVATGNVRALTHGRHDVASIHWSPTGDRLAFLAAPEPTKVPQLFVLPMNGGDALQVTSVKSGVSQFAWRPDGKAFAFAARDLSKPPKPAGYVAAFEVTDEHFLTREASAAVSLWTVDSDGSSALRRTSGKASLTDDSAIDFLPDGRQVVAHLQPDGVFAHFVQAKTMRIDTLTGAAVPVVADALDGGGPLSHDGTKIALSMPRHGSVYLQQDVSVRALADGHELASGKVIDRNVHWSVWTPDDQTLYVASADGVRSVLWRLAGDGSSQRVDLGDLDVRGGPASIATNGTLAFVGTTRSNPGDVYVLPSGAASPQKLTDENAWLAGYAAARRERIDWQSDGMDVTGVLTYPIGYDPAKKYPLVLNIHGGPVSASTWDFDRSDGGLVRVLAAHGYLVLEPNYRGSDNSGDAFLQAIVGDVTSGPGRDNLRGVEAVEALGIVDRSRIAVGGWSGGGLQTSWLVGHAAFWRAAVSGAAVDDWFEQAVLADINENFAATFLGGATPWSVAGRALYARESPLTYADRIRTPLLILSDVGDQRVPVTQSFALYRTLRDHGQTVKFMEWPRDGHFPRDPVGRESVFTAWAAWFDRWLK